MAVRLGWRGGDAAHGIPSHISHHAQDACAVVLESGVNLILKWLAKQAGPSAPCTGRVATLDHEILDDSMEYSTIVVSSLRKSVKVSACLGSVLKV